jgi:hypothetical protein
VKVEGVGGEINQGKEGCGAKWGSKLPANPVGFNHGSDRETRQVWMTVKLFHL